VLQIETELSAILSDLTRVFAETDEQTALLGGSFLEKLQAQQGFSRTRTPTHEIRAAGKQAFVQNIIQTVYAQRKATIDGCGRR
jgi:hypothetical protein